MEKSAIYNAYTFNNFSNFKVTKTKGLNNALCSYFLITTMIKKNNKRKSNVGIFILLIAVVLLASLLSILAIGMLYESYGNEEYNSQEFNLMANFNEGSYSDYVYCPLTEGVDTDEDKVFDLCDNCITYYNPDQRDDDYDGVGNACELLFAGRGESQGDGDDEIPECQDNKDNDGDGLIDWPVDPGCGGLFDDSESPFNQPQCNDHIDNDNDGLIDWPIDKGCKSEFDNSEYPEEVRECNDGIDNDNDGFIDWPRDKQCDGLFDDSESN